MHRRDAFVVGWGSGPLDGVAVRSLPPEGTCRLPWGAVVLLGEAGLRGCDPDAIASLARRNRIEVLAFLRVRDDPLVARWGAVEGIRFLGEEEVGPALRQAVEKPLRPWIPPEAWVPPALRQGPRPKAQGPSPKPLGAPSRMFWESSRRSTR